MRRAGPGAAAMLAGALMALAFAAPRATLAGTEEFSTFDVARSEEDDESLLDHLLTAFPRSWEAEWARSPAGFRTAQGCLTSGQWLMDTELRVATPLGRRARFGVELRQIESDFESWSYLDLTFRFPQRFGTLGVSFRPFYDKSRQDVGLFWEAGSETTAYVARATFGLEDTFNNLWAWRQTRVGESALSYERHPWEPALELGVRRERWRGRLAGKWLTPSLKKTANAYGGPYRDEGSLWGTRGHVALEVEALGATWGARATNHQAASSARAILDPSVALTPEQLALLTAGDHDRFRRLWSAEVTVRRALGERLSIEARGLYQARRETWEPPSSPGRFDAIDRGYGLEATWEPTPRLEGRAGLLWDRISVATSGSALGLSPGSRDERRGYVGLAARFARVRVFGIEGFELDSEPYDVWLIHDKGFLGLQATF